MSLTKDDLEAIGTLIDQRLEPVKNEQQVQGKTLKYLKKKVNKIDKTVDIIGRTYDEGIVENSREIVRIKDHLGISSKH